eukprot:TRINITY_DN20995_c0_g1_i1.p1 TRINITY_DN20995_c0_g1~~TRINITY_DN20995_c0_g1_i1.p1  ORF type:complete len:130 (+),score=20.79 TRINITY_DN20995_c0_g1_i1:59-448(+)
MCIRDSSKFDLDLALKRNVKTPMSRLSFENVRETALFLENKVGSNAGLVLQFISAVSTSFMILLIKVGNIPTFQMIHGRFLIQTLALFFLLGKYDQHPYEHKRSPKIENLLYWRGMLSNINTIFFYIGA